MKAYIGNLDWADEGDVFFCSIESEERLKKLKNLIDLYVELNLLPSSIEMYWGTNEFFDFTPEDLKQFIDDAIDISEEELAVLIKLNITGFDTSKENKNVPVKISFTENGITKDTTYLINVKDNVLSITLVGTPKTTYKYGENLNLNNLQINVVRQSDAPAGTNMPVTQSMISGYNPQVLGKQTVTVTYGTDTNGNPVTTTFEVKVEPN